jgi:hypothetical protein
VEAIQEAIFLMMEENRDRDRIGTLFDLTGNEAHNAKAELDKWFDGLSGHRQ